MKKEDELLPIVSISLIPYAVLLVLSLDIYLHHLYYLLWVHPSGKSRYETEMYWFKLKFAQAYGVGLDSDAPKIMIKQSSHSGWSITINNFNWTLSSDFSLNFEADILISC